MSPILKAVRHRPLVAGVLVASILLLSSLLVAQAVIEERGQAFYTNGRAIVETLGELAAAIGSGDLAAIQSFYTEGYSGELLGLGDGELIREHGGVRETRVRPPGTTADLTAAMAEWRAYLDRFESVSEVEMHLHRIVGHDAAGHVEVSARYKVIGVPHGAPAAAIDRGYLALRFAITDAGPRLAGGSMIEGDRVLGGKPHFVDVGPEAGIAFKSQYYPPFLTEPLEFAMVRYAQSGITTADVDNDGFYDLFIPDGVESKLFRNSGDGTFEDVTDASGLGGLAGVFVGTFADYDNDGHKDFFVSHTFEPNQLFKNNGDGTFTDVTAASGIGPDEITVVASWADIDLDGFLDLYVGRYLDPREAIPTTFYTRNGRPNRLYLNNGDGTFTDITESAGVAEPGVCLGTVFGDYDDDGDPDLYVVNDFGRNTLYRNNGDKTFTDVTVETNTLAYGAGMNASFGDFNNDELLDIYVTNIRSEHAWYAEPPMVWLYLLNSLRQGVWADDLGLYLEIFKQSGFAFQYVFRQMGSGNTLLQNNGDGTFTDVTWEAEANPPGWFWGSMFADYDNDGWQDLYSANGWVYNDQGTEIELDFFNGVVNDQKLYKTGQFFDPEHFGDTSWHGWERNRHLRNNGDGTFTEIGLAAGTGLMLNSRGIAVADYWNRGVLDIAVSANDDHHALLKNEVGVGRHWLGVELVGGAGRLPLGTNRDAVGARVTLRAGGQTHLREVVLGDGYASQNTLRLHFGLADIGEIEEMKVSWPRSGEVQTFTDVPVDRVIEVVEGEASWGVPSWASGPSAKPAKAAAGPPGKDLGGTP